MPQVQNMPKFRILQSPEFGRVLNMPGFWIWQGSEYAKLNRVLYMLQNDWICLNGTRISVSMSEFTIIDRVLNMCLTIQSVRSLYKLMSTYWKMFIFRTLSKILTVFAKHSILNLWESSEYVPDSNMSGFWILHDCQYARVLNFQCYTQCNYFLKYDMDKPDKLG